MLKLVSRMQVLSQPDSAGVESINLTRQVLSQSDLASAESINLTWQALSQLT